MVIMDEVNLNRNHELKNLALTILKEVMDPEIPVISVLDLGIVRKIEPDNTVEKNKLTVTITPTYSGCPALDRIRLDIYNSLISGGFDEVIIIEALSPAWTTDWISSEGADKLKAYGIAPPTTVPVVCDLGLFQHEEAIQCPRCNSFNTALISRFGSTPCKALYSCNDCKEPFDHFKCH